MAAAEPDLSSVTWRFPEFLDAYGGVLTPQNVLEYFSLSPFYDRQSTNQQLRMQNIANPGLAGINEAEELKKFVGIEFAVVHAQPPGVFVIHKRERTSPEHTQPIAAYYVMHENIYQAPDAYTVLSTRLHTALYALSDALSTIRQKAPTFTPRTSYAWPISDAASQQQQQQHQQRAKHSTSATPAPAAAAGDGEPEAPEQPSQQQQPPPTKKARREDAGPLFRALQTTATQVVAKQQERLAATALVGADGNAAAGAGTGKAVAPPTGIAPPTGAGEKDKEKEEEKERDKEAAQPEKKKKKKNRGASAAPSRAGSRASTPGRGGSATPAPVPPGSGSGGARGKSGTPRASATPVPARGSTPGAGASR